MAYKRDDSTAEDDFVDWSLAANDESKFQDEMKLFGNKWDTNTSPISTRRCTYKLAGILGLAFVGATLVIAPLVYQKFQSTEVYTTPISTPDLSPVLEDTSDQEEILWRTDSPTKSPLVWVAIPGEGDGEEQEEGVDQPTLLPTSNPTALPTIAPPTRTPTTSPTNLPTQSPTTIPTGSPTNSPTGIPTSHPSSVPSTSYPTRLPTSDPPVTRTYMPGNLTTLKEGLLLSEGLDVRLIAISEQVVPYDQGGWSSQLFHSQPDAGATFPDTSETNPGGWIYVSNSEVDDGLGGVGAITFDKDGNVIHYHRVLNGTSMNCGGGRTPWGTWVTCEEVEFHGMIYQVDPTGKRPAELMTLGSEGGRWESFGYDVRNTSQPHFFATEDHSKGTVRRFTPDAPDWDDPWSILHGSGTIDYLMLFPNASENSGTYAWTTDIEAARKNAKLYFPMSEGMDIYKNELYFVCKQIKAMFVLDLDGDTYYRQSTIAGLFDGSPDQIQRVLGDSTDLLYFTEEGGIDAGIHARDEYGQFYAVLESPIYIDETSGLAFSPDGRFMYLAYQNNGLLFAVWREDGLPFDEAHLDVKVHHHAP